MIELLNRTLTWVVSSTLLCCLMLAPAVAVDTIEIEDLWLRESVPGAENGAGFGRIHNHGNEDVLLVGAASPVAAVVELHQHVHRHNGQMAMEQMDALSIPAGESVTLQPGGYHLMLMQLTSPLTVGDTHLIELQLSTGERLSFEAEVHPLVR